MADNDNTPPSAPEFGDEYHKSRRNVTLASTFLIIWEYLGLKIEIQDVEVSNLNFSLGNPDSINVVILMLAIYFIIRYMIEWGNTSPSRRKKTSAKYDAFITYSIFTFSISFFIFRSYFGISFANLDSIAFYSVFTFSLVLYIVYAVLFIVILLVDSVKILNGLQPRRLSEDSGVLNAQVVLLLITNLPFFGFLYYIFGHEDYWKYVYVFMMFFLASALLRLLHEKKQIKIDASKTANAKIVSK